MLLEDRARSGAVTLTVTRQSPDQLKTKPDSVELESEDYQNQQVNRHMSPFDEFRLTNIPFLLKQLYLARATTVPSSLSVSTLCALRLPLPGRLSTVPNFTSSLLMLFFVLPLFRNFVINCWVLNLYIHTDFFNGRRQKLAYLLDTASKIAKFLLGSLRDDNVITSKPTWKLKHANSILETFEYFYRISSKSIDYILSYTVSKLGRFLRHSVHYWQQVFQTR